MWYNVKTEKDIAYLLNRTNFFHDTCIKEMSYVSGAYVTETLDMYPVNDKRELRVLILLQKEDLPAVELAFRDVLFFYVSPSTPDYTSEIHEAHLYLENDKIFWTDSDRHVSFVVDENCGFMICAGSLFWRNADHRGTDLYYRH